MASTDISGLPAVVQGNGSVCLVENRMGVSLMQSETQWVPDERDAFISWVRGEFAAANAIIDALCQHLQSNGTPEDYEMVLSSIYKRRYNWNPVLHMQHYYSVADVVFALHQVSLKKEPQIHSGAKLANGTAETDTKSKLDDPGQFEVSSDGSDHSHKDDQDSSSVSHSEDENTSPNISSNGVSHASKEEMSAYEQTQQDIQKQLPNGNCNGITKSILLVEGSKTDSKVRHLHTNIRDLPKEEADKWCGGLVVSKMHSGEKENPMESSKLYQNLFDTVEMSEIINFAKQSHYSWRNDKVSGDKVSSEETADVIQFGTLPSKILSGKHKTSTKFGDEISEPVPAFLDSVTNRLLQLQVIPPNRKPNSFSIIVLEEGDYMPPQALQNFEQPYCMLSLVSDCNLVFGQILAKNNPGEFDGTVKSSLPAGSLLVVKGNRADTLNYAVSAQQSTRILIVFGKTAKERESNGAQTNKSVAPSSGTSKGLPNGYTTVRAHTMAPSSVLVPILSSRSSGQVLQPLSPIPISVSQPVFLSNAMPSYSPALVASAWPAVSVSSPVRVPSPGTGVFFPSNGTSIYSSPQSNGNFGRRHCSLGRANSAHYLSNDSGVLAFKPAKNAKSLTAMQDRVAGGDNLSGA